MGGQCGGDERVRRRERHHRRPHRRGVQRHDRHRVRRCTVAQGVHACERDRSLTFQGELLRAQPITRQLCLQRVTLRCGAGRVSRRAELHRRLEQRALPTRGFQGGHRVSQPIVRGGHQRGELPAHHGFLRPGSRRGCIRDAGAGAEGARPGNLLTQLGVHLGEIALIELEMGKQQVHHADRQHRVGQGAGRPNTQRRCPDGGLALRDMRVALERLGDERRETRIALDGRPPRRSCLRWGCARRANERGDQQELSDVHASPHELCSRHCGRNRRGAPGSDASGHTTPGRG